MKPKKEKKAKETTAVAVVETVEIVPTQEAENISVETFIMEGIKNSVPVETMERLLAMRKDLKAEHAKEQFISAMSNFQKECPIIVKDKIVYQKNSDQVRYKYAPMDSIINQVRGYIAKNGLSYTVDVVNGDGLLTAICKITHVLGHSETSSFQVPIDRDGFMSAPQKYAAASTFAKRYALCNALGILTGDEDTDAVDADVVPEPQEVKMNPVIEDYRKKLQGVRNIEELRTMWANMPVQAKTALAALKEEMKAILTTETA